MCVERTMHATETFFRMYFVIQDKDDDEEKKDDDDESEEEEEESKDGKPSMSLFNYPSGGARR